MNDFLKYETREHKVKITNREVSAFRSKVLSRTGARIFTSDGKLVSASRLGTISDQELLAACEANRAVAFPAEGVPTQTLKRQWKMEQGTASADAALETAQEQIAFLSKELPDFIFSGQVIASSHLGAYSNSLGADLHLSYNDYGISYEFRRKGSPNIADAFFGCSSSLGYSGCENLKWPVELFQTYDRIIEIKPGKHKVLMIADDRSIAKIGESLSADLYSEGTALYSKRLGEKVFSDKFSLSDLRVVQERGGLKPFDYEGTLAPADKINLIERGVLKALISDLKNAKRHGIPSTGNGFRSYNSATKLQFANLAIDPGQRSYREILKDAGKVIVCFVAVGGDLTAQGDFSTPVQLAFLSDSGVIQGRLPSLSISSHIESMYGADLLEVASDGVYRNSADPYILANMNVQVI